MYHLKYLLDFFFQLALATSCHLPISSCPCKGPKVGLPHIGLPKGGGPHIGIPKVGVPHGGGSKEDKDRSDDESITKNKNTNVSDSSDTNVRATDNSDSSKDTSSNVNTDDSSKGRGKASSVYVTGSELDDRSARKLASEDTTSSKVNSKSGSYYENADGSKGGAFAETSVEQGTDSKKLDVSNDSSSLKQFTGQKTDIDV